MPLHRHLRRLDRIWTPTEIYFVTTCTAHRRPLLATQEVFDFLGEEWEKAPSLHGWQIGSFVIMPDHVHFFCAPCRQDHRSLSQWVGSFKQWTSKRLLAAFNLEAPFWQPEFFDHLLRSEESYAEKVDYVKRNPVRAGLVETPEQWPWKGQISELSL